jgi:hypothetical protein
MLVHVPGTIVSSSSEEFNDASYGDLSSDVLATMEDDWLVVLILDCVDLTHATRRDPQ